MYVSRRGVGTYSSSEALNAGLDLEMPGPTRWRTPLLLGHDILARKVKVSTVDARVKSVLKFVQRAAKELPEIVYGKDEERTLDNKDHRAIARQVATESIVLLKNTKNVLPLAKGLKRIAVFGSSAKAPIFTGGGSAEVGASYFISPFEGICEAAPQGCQIDYAVGATGHKGLPLLGKSCKTTSHNPTFGTTFDFYRADVEGNRIGDVVSSIDLFDSLAEVMDGLPCGLSHPWAGVMSGTFEPDGIEGTTDEYEFGLQVAGRAKLYLDDELVVENWSHQTPGNAFYNTGTIEVRKKFTLEKGRKYALRVDFSSIFGYEAPVPVGWGLVRFPTFHIAF
jgi:beta-glucosidase